MRSREPSTNIIFLRHGEPAFDSNRIYCDEMEDPQLTPRGVMQAKSAAVALAEEEVAAIYASPSARTQATADELAQVKGLRVQHMTDLMERRFGIWEGLYFDEIEERYPDAYRAWKRDPINFTPEGGETIDDLRNRLAAQLVEIIGRHQGETVVIVGHVGPIRVCVTDAFQMPIEQYRQLRIDHASLTRIDYGTTRNNLIYLNRINYR